jgi:putative restriction endonuclease
MADEAVRSSCFAALAVLSAEYGDEIPYAGGLDRGFAFRGRRVPFLNYQKGIYRAAVQTGRAALSINTSYRSPYDDEETDLGIRYAYRAGPVDQPDNRALRAAAMLRVPIVYFIGTRPGWYRPLVPCFVVEDDPVRRQVLVVPGAMAGSLDEPEPVLADDPLERRYAVRQVRTRVHQARFRGRVLHVYRSRCTICRLNEPRLLDAAHIVGDLEKRGEPEVTNGLSLCSIHHRAFDEDLVGITPDYDVRVSRRLLDDEDGPMLELLKGFDRQPIVIPERRAAQPDRARLEERYERFLARTA